MEKIEKAKKVAKKMNDYLDTTNIDVPILNNLKIIDELDKNVIFVATGDGIMEKFLTDGKLEKNESIDDRISKNLDNLSNSFYVYLEEYHKNFDFKIYAQDIELSSTSICRQVNAYFVDDNVFYQIDVVIGPFNVTDKYKKLKNINNVHNDDIVKNLLRTIKKLLDNTHYIDELGGK